MPLDRPETGFEQRMPLEMPLVGMADWTDYRRMTEPTRYTQGPVVLPDRSGELEPTPVDGCAGCRELDNVRVRARAGGDWTTVSDCNVLMRRHPEGHG